MMWLMLLKHCAPMWFFPVLWTDEQLAAYDKLTREKQ